MTPYTHFIGVDISKNRFEIAVRDLAGNLLPSQSFANNAGGFARFCAEDPVAHALIVVEATGGYEAAFVGFLLTQQVAVHRVAPRVSHHYMRSVRLYGKTDALDAAALARYGAERHETLILCAIEPAYQETLRALVSRRNDLVEMRVAEKNRRTHPGFAHTIDCINAMIDQLSQHIARIEAQITALVKSTPILKAKWRILCSIPGIGPLVAAQLLAFMPELGQTDRRRIASLAGVAPHPRQSGQHVGYRATVGGRANVRRVLFIAALASTNRKTTGIMRQAFEKLVANGKKKIVAIGAIMRKIITIANAKLRDLQINTLNLLSE